MKKTVPTGLTATALLLLLPAGLLAQTTGTSHPEALNDTITTSSPAPAQTPHYVKPSGAVPMPSTESALPAEPVLIQRRPVTSLAVEPVRPVETARVDRPDPELIVTDDPTSGVVMDVPSAVNELPAGSLIHASLSTEISTITTQRGAAFTARLLQPLSRRGEVLVPAGSMLSGRVAQVHAGNRLHGGAVIQLIPEYLTLPDGTRHRLQAQVVDLPQVEDANVNEEGVIHGKDNLKGTATGVGLTTASATVAGAMIGGGVGAAVGAGVGVGVATVWWLRHEQEQTLREGTEVVFSLDQPLSVAPAVR